MIPLNQPCFRRSDPKLSAAMDAAKAAGIKSRGRIGSMDAETFHRSVTIDAAESLGIPVEMLDAARESHIDIMTRVATQLILDEIEANRPG
ncbi:MAG: hypothetical protein QM627_00115 [Luteolibacter sp.]